MEATDRGRSGKLLLTTKRTRRILQLYRATPAILVPDGRCSPVATNSLSITDNRTGKSYELPISEGTVKAIDLRQIKTAAEDFGLMTYDPAFLNTAACRSAITYIDGDKGILRYRGYPIEPLHE